MDPSRFTSREFGKPVKTPGKFGFYAFEPARIPRSLNLDPETVMSLSDAEAALGRLAGAGRLLPNPHILVGPYMTREALASSSIEGTQASLSEVFEANAGRPLPSVDVREVQNYVGAMRAGLERLETLPLSLRLLREIHGELMAGVRGGERMPGEFRTSPNWIGRPASAEDTPETAIFVPPPPGKMRDALSDLERFMHESVRLPALVQCALLHYQFETIHPFLDGNGRLGRLLAVFFLVQKGKLPQPLLYLSGHLEQHRDMYYDRLQSVRERGEIQAWLRFFLEAVATQAEDAVGRAERLSDLHGRYRGDLIATTRSRAPEVVDLMVSHPVITVSAVEDLLGVTHQGALNIVRQIEARGWLSEMGSYGRGGRKYWVAPEIMRIIEATTLDAV